MCETLGLFGGYQNPGSGINPNAPKKKPFFRYWEVLWHNFSKLISLNLIYTLLHAPMFLAVIFFFETNNKFTYAMTGFLLAVQFLLDAFNQELLSGALRPGDQIPTEAELSEQSGVATAFAA